jgi:hypothetical protein
MVRSLRVAALIVLVTLAVAAHALANSAGTDPGSNHPAPRMPGSCASAPTGADCINASVAVLNQARASLGQPAYAIPSDFVSLTPAEQGFVLANLDRILYGLAPVTGLTAALDNDAAGGAHDDADPQPTASDYLAWTANWAGGFSNMPLAYEAWMYDDGPGSGNLDCSSSNTAGCWGHRHDVLYKFDRAGGALAMGVAQGTDSSGEPGYAMLLFQGDDTYRPFYAYTWAQAVAAGAGTGSGGSVGSGGTTSTVTGHGTGSGAGGHGVVPARVSISVRVRGRHVSIIASLPRGSHLQCAFTPHGRHGWARDHYRSCSAQLSLNGRRAGRYRLRVRAAGVVVTRYIRVR